MVTDTVNIIAIAIISEINILVPGWNIQFPDQNSSFEITAANFPIRANGNSIIVPQIVNVIQFFILVSPYFLFHSDRNDLNITNNIYMKRRKEKL
jgi:hypothetical protein